MKYTLAINRKMNKHIKYQEGLKLIDISSLTDLDVSSIVGISKFTATFENEKQLKEELYKNKLIRKTDLIYPLTICYKYKGYIRNICHRYNEDTHLLFKNDFHLFNPSNLKCELCKLVINDSKFDYKNCSQIERIRLTLIEAIAQNVLKDPLYEHCNAESYAYSVLNYIRNIKTTNYVDTNSIYYDIEEIVKRVSYYKSKKNEKKLDIRKLYEFIIYYVNYKNSLFRNLEALNKEKESINKQEKSETTNIINEQITINDILKRYDNEVQNNNVETNDNNEQITVFDILTDEDEKKSL